MIFISHRGCLNGPNINIENNPNQILKVLNLNFDVEVDIWYSKNKWWLGHDKPYYYVDNTFIHKHGLWLHCKNAEALNELEEFRNWDRYTNLNYFYHQNDDYTLTSKGWIWIYPGKQLIKNSVCVRPYKGQDWSNCYAVCADNIKELRIGWLKNK